MKSALEDQLFLGQREDLKVMLRKMVQETEATKQKRIIQKQIYKLYKHNVKSQTKNLFIQNKKYIYNSKHVY